MKKRILVSAFMVLLLVMTCFAVKTMASPEEKKVDVMFLHDTHSHLNAFATVEDGKTQVMGGFAKIKTLINEQKEISLWEP